MKRNIKLEGQHVSEAVLEDVADRLAVVPEFSDTFRNLSDEQFLGIRKAISLDIVSGNATIDSHFEIVVEGIAMEVLYDYNRRDPRSRITISRLSGGA